MEQKWWEVLSEYVLEKLEEYCPNYKEMEKPNLDIRWRLEDWSTEEAIKDGRMTLEQPKLSKEEIDEMMKKQMKYYNKYGNFRMPDDWNGE